MSLMQFYMEVLRRAFSGKFWEAEKWSGGVSLLYAGIVYLLHLSGQWELAITWVPLAIFAFVFLGAVAVGFVVAAWQMHREKEDIIMRLSLSRAPGSRHVAAMLELMKNDRGELEKAAELNVELFEGREVDRTMLVQFSKPIHPETLSARRSNSDQIVEIIEKSPRWVRFRFGRASLHDLYDLETTKIVFECAEVLPAQT